MKTFRLDLDFLVCKRGPDWPLLGQVSIPSPISCSRRSGGRAGSVALGGVVSLVGQAAFAQLFPQGCGREGSALGPEASVSYLISFTVF